MERAVKFLITFMLVCLFTTVRAFAEEDLLLSNLITPQNVNFNICTRTYILPQDKLFYMAIASANANNFTVEEIQSKTGYILFSAVGRQYLASVVKINSKTSELKITPTNNNYFFPPGVVLNFFRYIDLYGSTPLVTLPKA